MAIPQTGNTQSARFSEKLEKLRPDVTAQDRKDASKELKVTAATISRYLNGYVLDNDTAASLVTFFSARISEREKSLIAPETTTA